MRHGPPGADMTVDLTRYGLWYVAGLAGVVLLSILLQAVAALPLPPGVSAIVPPILAAMIEGQRMGRADPTPRSATDLWTAALSTTAVVAAINLVILGLFWMVPGVAQRLASVPVWILAGAFLALLVVVLLVNWFFLGQSIRNEIKRRSKTGG